MIKVNLCELLLTDFKFNPYEKANAKHTTQDPKTTTVEEIKFKNAKTSSRSLDPFTGKFASNDTVTLYRGEDSGDNENKSEANSKEGKKSSSDKTKPKNPYFTSIRRDEEDMEYKLKEGMVEMSCFKQSGDSDIKASNLVSNQASPHRLTYLNFTLLNFAKENNFTLRDDKASAMFDMKLLLAYGNEAMPTSYSSSNFTLTLQDLIIENENGEATDTDKVYLHHCSNKTVYESSSLVKNQDSVFKNSYTATFNIPIDKENKKDTKLIIYSSDLSKTHTTKDIHKRSDTAVISLSHKDKNNQSFCYLRKTSLRDITNNIINVISDNEYPFKTNEDITLKAIYKQEEKDEQGNENKKYKEVVWGYKVIKTVEYNEASKSNPKDVILLKNKKDERIKETKDNKPNKEDGLIKGKEITIQISKVVTKDDLAKLKQGGHSIIFFAALKEKEKKEKETDKKKKQNDKFKDTNEAKFQFNTGYGKTHMRVDIKIPLYIKFKDDRVIIYEFENTIKEKIFKANINFDSSLINRDKNIKDGYYYINKNIDQAQGIKIYGDENLNKTLNVKDEKNSQTLNNVYEIYANENSANSQILDSIIRKDKKYGINLLSKNNMDKFISSFNESKSLTRVDKGMWEDGDVAIKVEINRDIRILRIRAFMCAIKYGEGTAGANGYEINVGGKLFTRDYGKDFSDHPRYYVKSVNSTAAGAYQIMPDTWDMILKNHGKTYSITDFSPANQDKACLVLIKHTRDALNLIVNEKIDEAVRSRTDSINKRLNREWASMPDSPYGQRTITMEKFMEYYMYHLELEKRDISDLAIDDEEIKRFLD